MNPYESPPETPLEFESDSVGKVAEGEPAIESSDFVGAMVATAIALIAALGWPSWDKILLAVILTAGVWLLRPRRR